MYNPGIDRSDRESHDSWLYHIIMALREETTVANITGLIGALVAVFCLLLLPSSQYWNIRLPLYLIVATWTILRPRVALYLLPIAVPWGSLDSLSLGGLNLNSADILVALLSISWLMGFALRRFTEPESTHIGPLDRDSFNTPRYLAIAMALLLLAMLISMTTALSLSSSLKEISKWLEALVILFLGTQYIRTRRQIWTLVIILGLAAISQAMLGYTQAFLNLGPTAFVRDAGLRVYGTFGQPNPYAGYINMTLSITIALLLLARSWLMQILAGVATALLALALYLSQSRGGEIAIAAALLFILVVGMPRLQLLVRLGVIGTLGAFAAYLAGLLPERLFTPIFNILGLTSISFTAPSAQDFSTAERLAHWIAGIRMFMDHPITGVGIGNYADAYPHYFITIFVNSLGHAHNYYINMAAEAGILGLITLLLFLATVFVAGGSSYQAINRKYKEVKLLRSKPQPRTSPTEGQSPDTWMSRLAADRALAIGLLAALLSVCIHNFVDNLYVHGMTILFSLLLVILVRLEGMTSNIGNYGGQFADRQISQ